jgi:hypothetical protein
MAYGLYVSLLGDSLKPVVALNQMIETLSRDIALAIRRLASRVAARE